MLFNVCYLTMLRSNNQMCKYDHLFLYGNLSSVSDIHIYIRYIEFRHSRYTVRLAVIICDRDRNAVYLIFNVIFSV